MTECIIEEPDRVPKEGYGLHPNNFAGKHHTQEARTKMKMGRKLWYERKIQQYLDWEWEQTQRKGE